MDNVGAHTDPQRLLAVPGSQSADAQITKLSEGYAAWSEELVASSTSALDETIGSAAFAQLYASVAKAQGDTEISAVGHGRRIVGDTGNVLHGRITTKEHIQGVIRNAQVIAPRNIVFAPGHRLFGTLFVPCCQKRVITGDRLSLKEDAAQYLRSNFQITEAKRVAGALGGDVAGWTVPTSTVLPILLPQLTGVVKSMRAWMKLYLQYGVALMTEKAGGATYVPLLRPVLGNNLEDAPNQLPGRSHLINWQC